MNRSTLSRPGRRGWLVGHRFICVVILLALALAGTTRTLLAAPGDEVPTCAECHPQEANTWDESHHAMVDVQSGMSAATCTDCHGAYTAQHPDDDLMALDVSSATCATCHVTTYGQWESTIHAQNGVQCIGCHQAHSQELRLGGHTLCTSCHTTPHNDPFHKAHWLGETACTDCHMAGDAVDTQLAAAQINQQAADVRAVDDAPPSVAQRVIMASSGGPAHDFVTVTSTRCLDCHREDVFSSARDTGTIETLLMESRQANAMLSNELEATQSNLRAFQGMTPVALGLGLGLGGMIGIVFMLVVAGRERALFGDVPDKQAHPEDES